MAWRICASTKWPMRHLAITGMETAAWMPLIIFGSLMRLTPPAARMSAGMRSRAMTAQAPASSAMRACSGVVTSMITPPFSIWARLRFNSCLFCSMILFSFYCLIFCFGLAARLLRRGHRKGRSEVETPDAACGKRGRYRRAYSLFCRRKSLGVIPVSFLKNFEKWACEENPQP